MGASSKSILVQSETLEPRALLSAAASTVPVFFSFVDAARGSFDGGSFSGGSVNGGIVNGQTLAPVYIENSAGRIDWSQFTVCGPSTREFDLPASFTIQVNGQSISRTAGDIDGAPLGDAATPSLAFSAAGGATAQVAVTLNAARPLPVDSDADRAAYMASLASATGGSTLVAAPIVSDTGANAASQDDGDIYLSLNGNGVLRARHGKIGPHDLHGGQGNGAGSGAGSQVGASQAGSRSNDAGALLAVTPLTVTQDTAEASGVVTDPSSGAGANATAGINSSRQPAVPASATATAGAAIEHTFSMLPLVVAELQALSHASGVVSQAGGPQQEVAEEVAVGTKAAVASVRAMDDLVSAEAIPVKARLVNLFHVNAMATFSDALASFIVESASVGGGHNRPPDHSRAWKITAGVAAADIVFIAGWLASRPSKSSKSVEDQSEAVRLSQLLFRRLGWIGR